MKWTTLVLVAVAMAGVVTAWQTSSIGADLQPAPPSAKEVRGASPYIEIKNEPPPKLIVDEPLPDGLPKGLVWIQYRTENCRILPVFGKEALKVSPRVGHLHVRVDDLPWLWAHTSDINTIDIGGMPPGEHKVTIELVDAAHRVYPGQSILRASDRLFLSLTEVTGDSVVEVDPRTLVYGTRDPVARFHMEGTPYMPARPMLGTTVGDREIIAAMVRRRLEGQALLDGFGEEG